MTMLGEKELLNCIARLGRIEEKFGSAVTSVGLPFAKDVDVNEREQRRQEMLVKLSTKGVRVENGGRSLMYGWNSPACIACRKSERTRSFITSTQCPNKCFFCFNPNQPNYDYYKSHIYPLVDELQKSADEGAKYDFLAITGGEPLIHLKETCEFLRTSRTLYPNVHTRLYTTGFCMDDNVIERLADDGLDEVRFSVKLDRAPTIEPTLDAIRRSIDKIDSVMVEMPIMPDSTEEMKALMVRLDKLGIRGMNLLELGFPFHNVEEFNKRGYTLKPAPYRVVYGYNYSGGLPVQGSEECALELLEFAVDSAMSMGVHYCSLENRLTGQIYSQNAPAASCFPLRSISEDDFFLKSAKVFGEAIEPVRRALENSKFAKITDELDGPDAFFEFPLEAVPLVEYEVPDAAIGISYAIAEKSLDDDGYILRELKLERHRH